MAEKNRRRMSGWTITAIVLGAIGLSGLGYMAWVLFIGDAIAASTQADEARQFSGTLASSRPEEPVERGVEGMPVTLPASGAGEPLGVMFVPRFGENSQRVIAEGVSQSDVLDSETLGVGHYSSTQLPGQEGNFVISGHRSAYGGSMHEIEQLRLGDPIVIQTAQGWYTYRFRNYIYVDPAQVEVLNPLPSVEGRLGDVSYVTLITCNPLYSTDERIVAIGSLESWQPLEDGPPKEVVPTFPAVFADKQ